jgi:hypothetical protein
MRGAVIVGYWVACACSSDADTAAVAPSPPAPDPTEVHALLERVCAAATPCCGTIGVQNASPESCMSLVENSARGVILDLGEACLRELAPVDGGSGCFRLGDVASDPCLNMFGGRYGPSGPGDPCASDGECTAPVGGTSACLGQKCRWLFYGKEGPCIAHYGGETTIVFADVHATQGTLCDHGFYCAASDGSETRTCHPYLARGQSCTAAYQCTSKICEGPGCAGSSCNGVCMESQLGEQCSQSSECAIGGYCEFGICVPVKPAGMACQYDADCASGACQTDNVCSRLDRFRYAFSSDLCGDPVLFP